MHHDARGDGFTAFVSAIRPRLRRQAFVPGNALQAVSADSASDAWAIESAAILQWNGKSWKEMNVALPQGAALAGVSALSPSNVWAVGSVGTATGQADLTLHWNGVSWKQVRSPSPAPDASQLFGVSTLSRSSAWAVGRRAGVSVGSGRVECLPVERGTQHRCRRPAPPGREESRSDGR